MDFSFLDQTTDRVSIFQRGVENAAIAFDVTRRISEVYDNIISQNPIEDGSPSTDHITNLPAKISIEGGFSDFNISKLVGTAINQDAERGRAKQLFDRLKEIRDSREFIILVDGLHTFNNVQIKTLELLKETEGYSLSFRVEFWVILSIFLSPADKRTFDSSDAISRAVMSPQNTQQVGALSASPNALLFGGLV